MPIRTLQLLVILLVATLTGCGPPPRLPENTYANKTEAAVRSLLGKPDREFAGHFGAPPPDFTEKFSGEIKTLVFKKAGYEHYVTFEKRSTGWISICSQSVPEGSVF
ncbi:MAG: hypothetical protein JWN40_3226 [Phycisphaerales bacterium]|nr:hypothetical protein [Phycisphaerales bacterium]